MKITLNNNEEQFDSDEMTFAEVIKRKNFTFKMLITKQNDKIVKREERETTSIRDGDNIIVLHLISGG